MHPFGQWTLFLLSYLLKENLTYQGMYLCYTHLTKSSVNKKRFLCYWTWHNYWNDHFLITVCTYLIMLEIWTFTYFVLNKSIQIKFLKMYLSWNSLLEWVFQISSFDEGIKISDGQILRGSRGHIVVSLI